MSFSPVTGDLGQYGTLWGSGGWDLPRLRPDWCSARDEGQLRNSVTVNITDMTSGNNVLILL